MTGTESAPCFHYLLHPYPTFLVTCVGSHDRPNITTIASVIPVSVDPPLIAMSVRPTRHSYSLFVEPGEFVVNVPHAGLAAEALRCGRRSGRSEDKFVTAGLTASRVRHVRPPIIAECSAHLECRIVDDVEAGNHRLLIGEVIDAYADRGFTDAEGLRDVERAHPLVHVGRNRFAGSSGEPIEPILDEGD